MHDIIKGMMKDNRHNGTSSVEELDRYLKKHIKERREKITDLAINNSHWEYFITLTFSDKEIGEYSHDKAIEHLRKWIDNQKHQNRTMSYLLVSEFHKSGRLHFHGLIANVPKWILVEATSQKSGKKIILEGLQIYNLTNYKLGYTTVSKIQSQECVSRYISKYVTKEIINIKNKKTFWYSRDLEKPKIDYAFIDNSLEEHYKDKNITYNNTFIKPNCITECVDYLTSDNYSYVAFYTFSI